MLFKNTQYIVFYRFLPITTTLIIFILGYKGIIQQNIFVYIKADNNNVNKIIETKKTKKYLNKLLNLMKKEKPYVNPDFTISQLSNKLSISDNKLIYIIEKYLKFDFFTFINNYRIEYAKELLIDDKFIDSDLEDIAIMCGFISENSFEKIFKQYTFVSPGQYRIKALSGFKNTSNINLALFICNLNNYYENNIYAGVRKYTEEHGVNLICFVGSELESPYYNKAKNNDIYKLASIYSINGLISISGTLKSYISKNELNTFYKKFHPLPLVSIGVELENDNSETICASNKKEMKELMKHLIEFHGYKNIAFIMGSETNEDSLIRFNIYKDVLIENSILFNNDLIVSGLFIPGLGKEAVKILLDQRKVHVDAIVCVNDNIAITAIKELSARGIMVPNDIAVVGFDDNKDSKYMPPPLTTIRQPVFSLGYNAAKRLFSKLIEKDITKKIILPSVLCIRESCGCKNIRKTVENTELITINEKDLINYPEEFINTFFQKILIMILEESSHVSIGKGNEWTERLLKSFIKSVKDFKCKDFIETIKKILIESIIENMDMESWENIFSIFFNTILNNTDDEEKYNFINEIFRNTIKAINEFNVFSNDKMSFFTSKQNIRMQNLTNKFLQCSNIKDLNNIIYNELPNFGIKSCYLSIFEQDDDSFSNYFSKLILAYEDYKMTDLENKNVRYITKELIPGGFKHNTSNTYIIMPLNSKYENFGFIIYGIENINIGILPFFTIQITNVLLGFKLYSRSNKNIELNQKENFENNLNITKYKKSSLSKKKSSEYYKKLIDYIIRTKIYINTDLSLSFLAEQINISVHNLSFIINEYAGYNFYDFINNYRIEEVINKLSKLDNKKISVLDIAFDSGFKSKSTFNKIFKKHTSMTPTQYIKNKILDK